MSATINGSGQQPGYSGAYYGHDAPDALYFDASVGAIPPDKYRKVQRRRTARANPRPIVPPNNVPFWGDSDDEAALWDSITFNGFTYDGIVEVTGDGPAKKLDIKTAPGSDGARTVDKGYKPAKIRITLVCWTRDQFEDLRALTAVLHPRRLRERTAVDVVYPSLSWYNINRIIVEQIGLWEKGPFTGAKQITIDCVEDAPATAAPSHVVRPDNLGGIQTALPPPSVQPSAAVAPSATQAGP